MTIASSLPAPFPILPNHFYSLHVLTIHQPSIQKKTIVAVTVS